MDQAARRWAKELREKHPEVLRVGYFGSYARGDWGVGSDLDLVVVVEASDLPPRQRAVAFPSEDLPVPAEVLVYTAEEWESREEHSFLKTIEKEVVWVFRCERERG